MILHEAHVALGQSLQSSQPLDFSAGFEMCRSLDIEWQILHMDITAFYHGRLNTEPFGRIRLKRSKKKGQLTRVVGILETIQIVYIMPAGSEVLRSERCLYLSPFLQYTRYKNGLTTKIRSTKPHRRATAPHCSCSKVDKALSLIVVISLWNRIFAHDELFSKMIALLGICQPG